MKFIKIIIILFTLVWNDSKGQSFQSKWISYSDTGSCIPTKVWVDNSDNVLTTGYFKEINVDGNGYSACCGLNDFNSFIGKWNSSGDLLWLKRLMGDSRGFSIVTDNLNNIIVTGYFEGSLSFPSTPTMVANGIDHFIAKYSPSGTFLWAKQFNDIVGQTSPVRTDVDNNIYLLTPYQIEIDTITTTGTSVLTKLNSNGNIIWSLPNDIDIRLNGNVVNVPMQINSRNEVLIYGSFNNLINFAGNSYLPTNSMPDLIIGRIDSSGAEIGASIITNNNWPCYPNTISINKFDDVFVSGRYTNQLDFGTLQIDSGYYFLAKLKDTTFTNASNIRSSHVFGAVSNDDGTFLTGHGTYDGMSLFIDKYDTSCAFVDSVVIGSGNPNIEYGKGLATFQNNDILIGAAYVHTMNVGSFIAPGIPYSAPGWKKR